MSVCGASDKQWLLKGEEVVSSDYSRHCLECFCVHHSWTEGICGTMSRDQSYYSASYKVQVNYPVKNDPAPISVVSRRSPRLERNFSIHLAILHWLILGMLPFWSLLVGTEGPPGWKQQLLFFFSIAKH